MKGRSRTERIRRIICLALAVLLTAEIAAPLKAEASGGSNSIRFERIFNARDLGGYRTRSGRTVRKGMLIRCGELSYASKADIKKLRKKYKVGTVIDFRYPADSRNCKDKKIKGAEYRNISAKRGSPSQASICRRYRNLRSVSNKKLPSAAIAYFGRGGSSSTYNLVNSEYSKKQYRKFFKVLLKNKDGKGVVFHCVAGKDRTGVAAFMLLVALGVDKETAYRDYSLTNSYIKKVAPDKYRKGLFGVREKDLRAAVSAAERKYGSLNKFLESAYGLDLKKRKKLREIYTE